MKKVIVIALTVMLALAMSAVSLADVNTPFKDDSLKINVAVKMDEGDIQGLYAGQENAPKPAEDINEYGELYEGVFYVNSATSGAAWLGLVSDKVAGMNAKAEGFGFYANNTTGTDLTFVLALQTDPQCNLNNKAYSVGSNKEYVLVDMSGKETIMTAPEQTHPYDPEKVVHSYIEIPTDFEGYVLIPMSSTQEIWGTDPINAETELTGFGWLNVSSDFSSGGDLAIDNIFFYGASVEEKDADLIVIDKEPAPSDPTSAPETQEPTAEATNTASVTSTASASQSSAPAEQPSEGSFPWVIVIIAAAVVVIAVIVIAAAAKKKKDKE